MGDITMLLYGVCIGIIMTVLFTFIFLLFKTPNKSQDQYASAISGGNAEKEITSLDSRDASKSLDNIQDVKQKGEEQ